MKNLILLVVAAIAGVAAFAANYIYLEKSTTAVEHLRAIADIRIGEQITESNIGAVAIPGEAITSAMLARDYTTIVGRKAIRSYKAGELILLQDITGPRADLVLLPSEQGLTLNVAEFALEPTLIRVGDHVSFVASNPQETDEQGKLGTIENLGAYRIVAIGDIVHTGTGISDPSQYTARLNTITVAIQVAANGQLDDRAVKLIRASDSNAILRVLLAAPRETGELR